MLCAQVSTADYTMASFTPWNEEVGRPIPPPSTLTLPFSLAVS